MRDLLRGTRGGGRNIKGNKGLTYELEATDGFKGFIKNHVFTLIRHQHKHLINIIFLNSLFLLLDVSSSRKSFPFGPKDELVIMQSEE